ncbi:MAG TPA: methyltransferase [Alphaproteobacteria bacterium]|nr:methyltransferase [Alphaproteobacteria bacterium]
MHARRNETTDRHGPGDAPRDMLMRFIAGKWIAKPVYAAAALGISDRLAAGPRTAAELAGACGVDGGMLARVLRALAVVGVYRAEPDGRYALAPMGELLREGRMRDIALMFNAPWNDEAWARLLDGLRSGETPFVLAHGEPLFRWLERHPDEEALLSRANAVKAAATHRVVADACDLSGIGTLVDVGGGDGSLLAAVLERRPALGGIIAERPTIAKRARRLIDERGLAGRCAVVECDFFEAVPAGDACLLSNILHDWDDDRCESILRSCAAALPPGGRIILVETVVPEGEGHPLAALLDLEMLVVTGGRERAAAEYRRLLEAGGFDRVVVTPTLETVSVIEGRRR